MRVEGENLLNRGVEWNNHNIATAAVERRDGVELDTAVDSNHVVLVVRCARIPTLATTNLADNVAVGLLLGNRVVGQTVL